MSIPTLNKIKVERIDEEESSYNDLMFPPYHPELEDVNSYGSKSHVLKCLKKEFFEEGNPESAGCGFTYESTIESPINSTKSEELVNCYDNEFDVLKQPKREFIEVEIPESSYSFTNETISEANKTVEHVVVKQDIPYEYNEYEELFLSVKVKKGDRKYQGRRKTEGINNKQGDTTSISYDVLVTNKQVSCKFCDGKFKNSTQQSSQWPQNITVGTKHYQDMVNIRRTINVIVDNNKKERQKRYREQNREKLKQREAERRKRLQQSTRRILGLSTFSNTKILEVDREKIIIALEQKRERQRRYRERNRAILRKRELERRKRKQYSESIVTY